MTVEDDPRPGKMRQKITDSTNILNVEKSASRIDWAIKAIVKYGQFQQRRLPMRCLMMSVLFLAMCGMSVLSGRVEAQISSSDSRTNKSHVQRIEKKEEVVSAFVSKYFSGNKCYESGCTGPSDYEVVPGDKATTVTCNFAALGSFKPSFCYKTEEVGAKCKTYEEGTGTNLEGKVQGQKVRCEGFYPYVENGKKPVQLPCSYEYTVCFSTEYAPFKKN